MESYVARGSLNVVHFGLCFLGVDCNELSQELYLSFVKRCLCCVNSQGAEMKWEVRVASWGNKQEAVLRRVDLSLLKLFLFVLNIHQTQDVNKMGSLIYLDFCKQLLICLPLPCLLSIFHQLSDSCL